MLRYPRVLALVLLASVGLAIAPRLAHADEEIPEEARMHFRAGVAFLKDPDGERPEEAYAEFKLAYALSKSPKVLGNLALCAMKLERDGEAIEAYRRYAMEVSDIDADERRQVNSDIAMLSASAVKVTLRVAVKGTTLVDTRVPFRGLPITNFYGPIEQKLDVWIRAGHHRIQAKSGFGEGAAPVWEFDAIGGSELTHEFLPPPPPPAPVIAAAKPGTPTTSLAKHSSLGPIVTMGLGVALLASGGVTGVIALGKTNDIARACPNDACPAGYSYERRVSAANTIVTATDILLLSGAVVTLGGAAWFFFSGNSSAPPPATTASAMCTSSGCGASLRYVFQ